MNHTSNTLPRGLILCTDRRLSRLLETELAYLGIMARSTEILPSSDGELCLIVADGDGFDPKACAEAASACGCPLLLFGRESLDPAALPSEAVFLRRPFSLSDLEQYVRSLLTGMPAHSSLVGMSRNPAAPKAAPVPASPVLAVENGAVTGFLNLIDLKTRVFSKDGSYTEGVIPDEFKADVDTYRDMLLEAIAETSDELMEKYFAGEEITREEAEAQLSRKY